MNEFDESNKNNGCRHDYCDEYKDKIDKVVRWDKFRIDQLSITNNLILTLSLAFLGYVVTQDHEINNYDSWLHLIKIVSISLLLVSLITGAWTSYNRLLDFRYTSKITKKKKLLYEVDHGIKDKQDTDKIKFDINILEYKTKKLGDCTWILLIIQLLSFLFGAIHGILFLLNSKG